MNPPSRNDLTPGSRWEITHQSNRIQVEIIWRGNHTIYWSPLSGPVVEHINFIEHFYSRKPDLITKPTFLQHLKSFFL